jgi:hypothetical protein
MKIAKNYWILIRAIKPQQGQTRVAPVRWKSGKCEVQTWCTVAARNSNLDSNICVLPTAVQWMRERFNECLDRAFYSKNKCEISVSTE